VKEAQEHFRDIQDGIFLGESGHYLGGLLIERMLAVRCMTNRDGKFISHRAVPFQGEREGLQWEA